MLQIRDPSLSVTLKLIFLYDVFLTICRCKNNQSSKNVWRNDRYRSPDTCDSLKELMNHGRIYENLKQFELTAILVYVPVPVPVLWCNKH